MWMPTTHYGEMLLECQFLKDLCCAFNRNDGFWLLWGIFKEYIKQDIVIVVLQKANSHEFIIYRLIENHWVKSLM